MTDRETGVAPDETTTLAWMRSVLRPTLLANHYPALHGLRVIAILSVIQIHLCFELWRRGFLPNTTFVYQVSQRLWFGMDLFFFLSGFLIGNLLLIAADGKGVRGILRFYARRTFRIVPAYYVVLTLLAVTVPHDALTWAQLPREYLYLTNYSNTVHVVMFWAWSLSAEEHFYLAVPLLLALLGLLPSHRARIVALTLLWLSGAVVRSAIILGAPTPLDPFQYFHRVYIPTHTRFDILVAGVLLAYVMRTYGDALRSLMARRWARVSSVVLSVALFGALMTPAPFSPPGLWAALATGTVTGVAYSNLVLYLLLTDGWASKILGARVFLWLATLGYGVYLVHMPLVTTVGLGFYFGATAELQSGPAVALLLGTSAAFVASLAAAYLLHLFVEKPSLWARDRVAGNAGRAKSPVSRAVPSSSGAVDG